MSRYENIQKELLNLTMRQIFAVLFPSLSIAVLCLPIINSMAFKILIAATIIITLPFLFHRVCCLLFRSYQQWIDRSNAIRFEIENLRKRIDMIYQKYDLREKGEKFKYAYELAGRSIRDLEEALSVGMLREKREVFVTAFMRRGVAVRVTASIGSPFRCKPSDDPEKWRTHFERLGCDSIRQYHNHRVYNGRTHPSPEDFVSSKIFKSILGPHGSKLCSLIICWNDLREWKIYEYDGTGRHSLQFEFDAAKD